MRGPGRRPSGRRHRRRIQRRSSRERRDEEIVFELKTWQTFFIKKQKTFDAILLLLISFASFYFVVFNNRFWLSTKAYLLPILTLSSLFHFYLALKFWWIWKTPLLRARDHKLRIYVSSFLHLIALTLSFLLLVQNAAYSIRGTDSPFEFVVLIATLCFFNVSFFMINSLITLKYTVISP